MSRSDRTVDKHNKSGKEPDRFNPNRITGAPK